MSESGGGEGGQVLGRAPSLGPVLRDVVMSACSPHPEAGLCNGFLEQGPVALWRRQDYICVHAYTPVGGACR